MEVASKELDLDVLAIYKGTIVSSYLCGSLVCSAQGSSAKIFNPGGSSTIGELNLDCLVDAVCIGPDAGIVFLGLRNGSLLMYHMDLKAHLWKEIVKVENSSDDECTFRCLEHSPQSKTSTDYCSLLALLSDGSLYIVNGVPNLVTLRGQQDAKAVIERLKVTCLATEQPICAVYLDSSTVLCCEATSALTVWKNTDADKLCPAPSTSVALIVPDTAIQSMLAVPNGSILITLLVDGSAAVWNTDLMVVTSTYRGAGKVLDAVLWDAFAGARPLIAECKPNPLLCCLTEDRETKKIQVVSLPGLELLKKVLVGSSNVQLVRCGLNQDYFCFFEEDPKEELQYRLKKVSIVKTSDVLLDLLEKNQFIEAEAYASDNDLSKQDVYKKKCAHFLQSNRPLSEVKQTLDCIEDIKYVVTFCTTGETNSLFGLFQLLQYAEEKIISLPESESAYRKEMLVVIRSSIHKLTSFDIISGTEPFQFQVWLKFQSTPAVDLLRGFMSDGKLVEARLILQKHQREIEQDLTEASLTANLHHTPAGVPLSSLTSFTRVLLATVVSHLPHLTTQICAWFGARVTGQPHCCAPQWIGGSLSALNSLLATLTASLEQSSRRPWTMARGMTHSLHSCQDGAVDLLRLKIKQLEELEYIESLGASVPLKDVIQDFSAPERLVHLMLDATIAPEQVVAVVGQQVEPYCDSRSLNLDAVLLQYVKFFLAKVPQDNQPIIERDLDDLPWEAKVVAVIGRITGQQSTVEAVCELVGVASVPWSRDVGTLVEDCLVLNLPDVELLQQHCSRAQLKKIGRTYGVSLANLENIPGVSPKWILRKIVFSGKSTALEDALKMAEACKIPEPNVHMVYIQYLRRSNKLDEVLEHLYSLPSVVRVEVAERWACQALETSCLDLELNQLGIMAVRCLLAVEGGTTSAGAGGALPPLQTVDSTLRVLHHEFSEFPCTSQLLDQEHCQNQVGQYISSSSGRFDEAAISKLVRYASCYGVGEVNVLCDVMLFLLENGRTEEPLVVCLRLSQCEVPPASVHRVCCLVEFVWGLLTDPKHCLYSSSLNPLLCKLFAAVNAAVFTAREGQLCGLVRASSAVRFMLAVLSKCSASIDPLDSSQLFFPIHKEILDPMYYEEAQLFEQQLIVPYLARYHLSKGSFCGSYELTSCDHLYAEGYSENGSAAISLLVNNLLYQHAYYLAEEMLVALQYLFAQHEDYDKLKKDGLEFIDSMTVSMCKIVLSKSKVDHLYAVGLLCCLTPTEATKLVHNQKATCEGYTKIMAFSNVVVQFAGMMKLSELLTSAISFHSIAKWGKILREYKVDYSAALTEDLSDVVRRTLDHLMTRPDVPFKVVMDYYKDQTDPPREFPCRYLCYVLTEWKEGYETRAVDLVHHLDHSDAWGCLQKATFTISPYDYERILFILKQLALVGRGPSVWKDNAEVSQDQVVLDWLMRYRRHRPPTQEELDYSDPLDPIGGGIAHAAVRLPYHQLVIGENKLSIVVSELNGDTAEALWTVAPALGIEPNEFIESAIKHLGLRLGDLEDGQEEERGQAVRALEIMFSHITNAEFALGVAHYLKDILNGDSESYIRVLKHTLSCVDAWHELAEPQEERERASEASQSLMVEIQDSTVLYLLNKNELNSDATAECWDRTKDLIGCLFTEQGSLSCRDGDGTDRAFHANLHEVVEEIAAIHHVDLKIIKQQLVNRWLNMLSCTSSKVNPLDSTLDTTQILLDETLQPAAWLEGEPGPVQEEEAEVFFRRLVCLLSKKDEIEENLATLFKFAKNSSSPYKARSLALRVALHLADKDVIKRIGESEIDEVIGMKHVFHFLSELEVLGNKTNVEAYISCDKATFVYSIVQIHGHQPKALRLVADIMAFYHIFDETLWTQVLHLMMKHKQFKVLQRALLWLSRSAPLDFQVPCLVDAWQLALVHPGQEAELPLTPTLRDTLLDKFHLIVTCPCRFSLDLMHFIKYFCRLGITECALVCTHLLPSPSDREALFERIIVQIHSLEDVRSQLELLTIPQEMLETIFAMLSKYGKQRD